MVTLNVSSISMATCTSKLRNAQICVHTQEPDYSDVPEAEYDLSKSVYGNVSELIPKDTLQPHRRHVALTHYVDANLYHDMLTGCSITGILHFMNKTPIDWYSKKQATIETSASEERTIPGITCQALYSPYLWIIFTIFLNLSTFLSMYLTEIA